MATKTRLRHNSSAKGPDQEPSAPDDKVRHRIKKYLVQRFYTRFHMSLILMGAGLAAMVSNWALLHWGVTKMWMRYPVAVTLSYLTFLAGVWLWIQYVEFRRDSGNKNSLVDGGDIPDPWITGSSGSGSSVEIPAIVRGGGGSFDGGGAAGEWADAAPVQALVSGSSPGGSATSSSGFKDAFSGFGDLGDLDGEGLIIIVLALLLIASLFIVSGYILWFAPDILSEAIFGATLAGSVARAAKREDNQGWITGVVKKTWWPFAIVFGFAMVFALYAGSHYPEAKTLGEVWQLSNAR